MNPVNLIVAFGLANVLAAIPITPGGLGVVEAVLTPTLVGFGLTKDTATVGVLAYRFVQFWLPIPLGGLAYASLKLGSLGRRRRLDAVRDLAAETASRRTSGSGIRSPANTAIVPPTVQCASKPSRSARRGSDVIRPTRCAASQMG